MSTNQNDTHAGTTRPAARSTNDTLTKAERRYEKNLEQTETSLPSWHTPARRRLLVQLNWICIAIMAAIAVGGYFWLPIVIAWLPMTFAIITSWTMLRVSIDSKDVAPSRYLDEFEASTLLHARSRALSVTTGILFVIAIVLIFASSLQIGDGHRLAYCMGGLAILTFFVASIIPASAMAKSMAPEDEANSVSSTSSGSSPHL